MLLLKKRQQLMGAVGLSENVSVYRHILPGLENMAVQDDHMIRNIQDIGRLIAKLLLHEQMPDYRVPENEEEYSEADKLFAGIITLADEGEINQAENELLVNMVEDDMDYLELALTFYLYLNDMDGDFLDDHDYSREEVLEGMKALAEDWGVIGLDTLV